MIVRITKPLSLINPLQPRSGFIINKPGMLKITPAK